MKYNAKERQLSRKAEDWRKKKSIKIVLFILFLFHFKLKRPVVC